MSMMKYLQIALVTLIFVLSVVPAFAQGSTQMWYIGPFEGDVTVKDWQTPGRPGYYYQPMPSETPTFAERYDQPVRCVKCGNWRGLGMTCRWCGLPADPYEQSQARQGAIYSPRPIPGQYWYDKPMRSTTGPKHGMGWPYLSPRYSR